MRERVSVTTRFDVGTPMQCNADGRHVWVSIGSHAHLFPETPAAAEALAAALVDAAEQMREREQAA